MSLLPRCCGASCNATSACNATSSWQDWEQSVLHGALSPTSPGALPAEVALTLGTSHVIATSIFLPTNLKNIHSTSDQLRRLQPGSLDIAWSLRRFCTHGIFLWKYHKPHCLPLFPWISYCCLEVLAAPPHCTGLSCRTIISSFYCSGKDSGVRDWILPWPCLDARQRATINIALCELWSPRMFKAWRRTRDVFWAFSLTMDPNHACEHCLNTPVASWLFLDSFVHIWCLWIRKVIKKLINVISYRISSPSNTCANYPLTVEPKGNIQNYKTHEAQQNHFTEWISDLSI